MPDENNPYQTPPQPPQQPYSPHQQTSDRAGASALDAIIPTNPLAVISCYSGIFSIICCFIGLLLGPVAITTGFLGLKKTASWESEYGATTSKIRMWIGIVTGIIGTILGIIAVISMVVGSFR
ncbi:MAG: hypothetical protein R3C53_09810 [Pirellulaceae bacterium]